MNKDVLCTRPFILEHTGGQALEILGQDGKHDFFDLPCRSFVFQERHWPITVVLLSRVPSTKEDFPILSTYHRPETYSMLLHRNVGK